MKQFLAFAITAFFSLNLAAQELVSVKTIHGPAFENLVVSGRVTVELVESENTYVQAEGTLQFANDIEITWTHKEVNIVYSGREKGIIKVYVKNLKNIYAGEGAQLMTPQPLRSENLYLDVNGESAAKIKNYGKIRIGNSGDIRVKWISHKE